MHAIRGPLPRDAPKVERNRAIVQARKQGLDPVEVARMFEVSASRVRQICTQAERLERFAQEHAESGGRARARTLGARSDVPEAGIEQGAG